MRQRFLLIAIMSALFVAVTGANAKGPPVVNEIVHFVNEPFGGIGPNCATGNLAESDGAFSGVIHTLVKVDGSFHVSSHTRGTDTLDDLPADGIPDATTTFRFNSVDSVLSSGKEVHHFTGNGTLTLTATGARVRFHVVTQLVIDENGDAKVDFVRITCE